jgi:hypothetical protein
MFNQYNEPTNYMTLDSSSLNPYNFKQFDNSFPTYQQHLKQFYFTRQIKFIWLCAVDFVLEEMGLKKDNENGAKMYEEYVKQCKTFIYNNVTVEGDEASEVAK